MAAICEQAAPLLPLLPRPSAADQGPDFGGLQVAASSAAMQLLIGCYKAFICIALLRAPPEVETQFWHRLSLGGCSHCLLPSSRRDAVAQEAQLQSCFRAASAPCSSAFWVLLQVKAHCWHRQHLAVCPAAAESPFKTHKL